MTTVSTLDPIKAYFTVSEQEYLDFHRRFPTQASRDAERKRLRLELILADGTTYPQKGSFYFADRQVNQSTGAIRVAGLFPNPGNILRPGQYGQGPRVDCERTQGALLVPQRAVTELQGSYQVAVVDAHNKVDIRTVKVGDRVGTHVDHRRRAEAGRARGRRRRAEGSARRAGEPEAVRGAGGSDRQVDSMSKFFINRPIVAMVISILMVIVGAVTIAGLPDRAVPRHRAAGSADSARPTSARMRRPSSSPWPRRSSSR